MRTILSVLGVVILSVVLLGEPTQDVLAQEDACSDLAALAQSQAQEFCADVARGSACYAHTGITVTGENLTFAANGDTVDLAAVETLTTAAANPESGEWGVVKMMLPASLPEDSAVTAILFGEAQFSRPPEGQGDRPTLTVTNSGTAPVNLRDGAGTFYAVAGQLAPGESATAEGRNNMGDWVRIQFGDRLAWVFASLLTPDGDINTLEVLPPDDLAPAVQSGEPLQSLQLTTGTEAPVCGAAPSGLLLQYTGEETARLIVNGVTLVFSDATLLVRAGANASLDVTALTGSATVSAHGGSQQISADTMAQVGLGGESGLIPVQMPTLVQSVAFATMSNVPVTLLPNAMTCMVGLPAPDAKAILRVGPGEQRGTLSNMDPNKSYTAIGWANDGSGAPWWQLDTGLQKSWVAQSEVGSLGACDAVAQVEAPPLVFAPPSAPPAGEGTPEETVDDYSPDGNSVWQMYPGSDNMSGTCSGTPAINFCDHLAAISPAQGGIMWKGMEASPYYLVRIQPNVYAYSGPNVLGTGTINMTLSFKSETEVTMTQSLTLTSEPDCQHVYNYTGTRNW
jgi:uncharacterized protein YgiM (DUF1202 family)